MEILKKISIPDKERKIIAHLHWNQKAVIRCESETTKEIEIEKGVWQGCALSPALLNVYLEAIFKVALIGEDGVEIGEKRISNIHFVDDTVLISDSMGGQQNILQ